MRNKLRSWLMLAIVLAGSSLVRADPVTDPATAGITEDGTIYGPYPFGVSLESDRWHSTGQQQGTSTQAALGDLSQGRVGFVATQGHVVGPDRQSAPAEYVDSIGTVWFSMSVNPLGGGLVLPAYPVRVSFMGEASLQLSGAAMGGAIAVVSFDGSAYTAGHSPWGTFSDGFTHVMTLWLSPGLHHGFVQAGGWGGALCQKVDALDPDDQCIKGTASYTAVADPSFAFDQAAYDDRFPDAPLALTAEYRIDVNPNVPVTAVPLVAIGVVPEPAPGILLVAGLTAMAGLVGRRRRRALRAPAADRRRCRRLGAHRTQAMTDGPLR